jgi:oligoendopeptidase F
LCWGQTPTQFRHNSSTDTVYTDVDIAVTGGVISTIAAKTTALTVATDALTGATALSTALTAAENAQTAYTTAGGLATAKVYTDVDDAVAGEVTATIVTKTTDLKDATVVVLALVTAVNVATTTTAMKTAIADANLHLDLVAYTALGTMAKNAVAQELIDADNFADAPAVQTALDAAIVGL